MENDKNWNYRPEDDAPQDYTQHPTGARFIPNSPEVSNDKFIASKPEKLEALENDLENDYPNNNRNTLQSNGQNDSSFSDDNPVMGSENSFDTFNDTDPNRYNNNAGLGFNDKTENEFIARDLLNDDFESNEFDRNSESNDNYPKHPEF